MDNKDHQGCPWDIFNQKVGAVSGRRLNKSKTSSEAKTHLKDRRRYTVLAR
jgi:hypothetical protein